MCDRAHSWRPGERPAGGVALVWGAGPCPASPARLAAAPFCEEDFKALTVELDSDSVVPFRACSGVLHAQGCCVGRGLSSSLPCILSWTLGETSTGGELGGRGVRVL